MTIPYADWLDQELDTKGLALIREGEPVTVYHCDRADNYNSALRFALLHELSYDYDVETGVMVIRPRDD